MEIYLADLVYTSATDKWAVVPSEYLENYTELIWTKRWQDVGDFVLNIPTSSLKTVTNYDNLINRVIVLKSEMVNGEIQPNDYMIIEKAVLSYDLDNNEILTLEGKDLLVLLQRRIIWGQQSFRNIQTVKSAVDTIVTDAIINPTDTNRKIGGFGIGTYTASDSFDAQQSSYANLFEKIVELCGDEYSPQIVLTDTFTFTLYQGTDRTLSSDIPLVFSQKMDNLEKYEWLKDVSDFKNAWLCAGEGEGAERKIQTNYWNTGQADDKGIGIYRRELYIDARDISSEDEGGTIPEATYNKMLQKRIEEKRLETWIKEASTAELLFEGLIYGVDYSIGDKATVIDTLGNSHDIRITELIKSENEEGYKVYPSFQLI